MAIMDADLQHPPEKLLDIVRRLENGADLVVASRYSSGENIRGWSLYRKATSRGATFLAHLLLPETRIIRDPVSGFFAFKREAMKCPEISTESYKILLEVLHQTRNRDIEITEVPFTFTARKRGASKLAGGEIVQDLGLLLELCEYRIIKQLARTVLGVLGLHQRRSITDCR